MTSSVADSLLWPPDHQLVNVGLSVDVHPADAALHLLVFGDDHADSSDARDIAPDNLRLRAERNVLGTGRVYLVVAEATNDAGTSFDVSTVAVPRFNTPDDIASVELQALGAETCYRQYQTVPPGFSLLGEGPAADGSGAPQGTASVAAFGPALATSQGPSAVPGSTVTAVVRSGAPVSLAVQPDQPATGETVPPYPAVWDNRHAQDAIFAGWEAVLNGLTLNWQ